MNPLNAHRWACLCADCLHWWGTPAGESIRRMWEYEHEGDDEAQRADYQEQVERVQNRAWTSSATLQADPPSDGGERDYRPRHYSTGRLTQRQAEAVNGWRALLLSGGQARPRASTSDVIASQVEALLAEPPPPVEIVWYAVASHQAHRAASRTADRSTSRAVRGADVPRHPPVSFYLTVGTAERYEELRRSSLTPLHSARQTFESEAQERFPRRAQAAERRAWVEEQFAELRIPAWTPPMPAGLLARLAIERAADLSPRTVVAEADAYSSRTHLQRHRARVDMHKLQR